MHAYDNSQQYLAQSVLNASPARLRLMLIERGVQLAQSLAAMPRNNVDQGVFDDQTLRLRDILGELLSGVSVGETQIAQKVSDLYVFLLQHLSAAEAEHDPALWNDIAHVLEIERETWQMVCGQQASAGQRPGVAAVPTGSAPVASLNLQG